MRLEDFTEGLLQAPEVYIGNWALTDKDKQRTLKQLAAIIKHGVLVLPISWDVEWMSIISKWEAIWNAELGTIWAD